MAKLTSVTTVLEFDMHERQALFVLLHQLDLENEDTDALREVLGDKHLDYLSNIYKAML